MRSARIAAALLLLVFLAFLSAGCQIAHKTWQPRSPTDVLALPPDSVRVSVGYMQLVLHEPRIVGDSLVGFMYDRESLWSRVAVPVDSVERTDIIETDAGRTALGLLWTAASLFGSGW